MKAIPGQTVDQYIAALSGWEAETVAVLRAAILAGDQVTESVKWTNPMFQALGPVCLVRAQDGVITFGFWRGADLLALDARLKRHGLYDMASIRLREPETVEPDQVRRLVAAAVALNRDKGDPTKIAKA
ncbi:hypothetical protein BH11PSE2_BH11PSE2_04920 [soil metagenome]